MTYMAENEINEMNEKKIALKIKLKTKTNDI